MEWRLQVTLEWNRLRFETWNSIQQEDLKSNFKLREKISEGNKKEGRGKKILELHSKMLQRNPTH